MTMEDIIIELLLEQKIQRLREEVRRLNDILHGPAASASLWNIEKNSSLLKKRKSQIPLPLAVIEKRRAERLQPLQHAPKPPSEIQMKEKSFRQRKAERLLRPLQDGRSPDESFQNLKMTSYEPLPEIESNGGLDGQKKVKYNYLGKFERKVVRRSVDLSLKKKAIRLLEKLSEKEEDDERRQRRSKYNYLGRFKKDQDNKDPSDQIQEQRRTIRQSRLASSLLPECTHCGRRFAENRLDTHMDICSKIQQKKCLVFSSSKQRKKGSLLEGYISIDDRGEFKMAKSKDIKNASLVTCPQCRCRMAPRIAQVHIVKCVVTEEDQD